MITYGRFCMRRKYLSLILGPVALTLGLATGVSGCANSQFSQFGASILSQTGIVSETQARGLLDAGGSVVKSQEGLTAEQEYYLGRAVSATILGKFSPSDDAGLRAYVNRVGRTVANVSDVPETFKGYHFQVLNSDVVNAMSAPSGFIFVTKGFLRLLPDEDALAAVLAHEVAHIVKRHGVNAISNAGLISALSKAGQQGLSIAANQVGSPVDLSQVTDMLSESVTGVTDKLLTSGFDRRQEYDADEYAAMLLVRAGYDSGALIKVLDILKKNKGSGGGWYDTHPDPDDRIDEVKSYVKSQPQVEPGGTAVRAARFSRSVRGG